MKLMFRNLFTGRDNQTHDLGRVSWAGSHVAVTAAALFNAWHGSVVDLMMLAGAHSAIAAAHSASLWAKRETEPEAPKP